MTDVAEARSGQATRDSQYALIALVAIFVVTVGWWALALWPVPSNPEWLDRARIACFNAGPDGLPDASGWMLLIGQPLSMVGFLMLVWPGEVTAGLSRAMRGTLGRSALVVAVLIVLGGLTGATVRVASGLAARAPRTELPVVMTADEHPRLEREAPALGLVNQHGELVTLASLAGKPALVTFAFANCHDICPMVVEQARAARDHTWTPDGAALVIVTLDPWRDTPARLPSLASRWALDGANDHIVGGTVEDVEAALDAWNVARTRDTATGQIAHPPLTYVLDADGTIAFVTLSGGEVLRGLTARVAEAATTH